MIGKTPPFISVVIPTYNRLSLLKETVDSVRGQTFRDFEIIVVNDGSTDGTADWLATQPDLKIINQDNRGIAASRNAGIMNSAAKWVAFLDHDDIWNPDKLLIQAEFISHNPEIALVAAKHVRLGKNMVRRPSIHWAKGDLYSRVFSESFIHTSSVMIKREVLNQIGGFPTCYRFADEFDVWLKVSAKYDIAYVDVPLVFIRFYDQNTSHDRVGVRSDTYDILLKNYDPKRISRRVFLRTMSDHDISFGRAYVNRSEYDLALKWFRLSLARTPFRIRSMRYFIKYWLMLKLYGKQDSSK